VALADATVRVILDVSRFDRDLQRKVESAARRAGRKFESEFTKSAKETGGKWAKDFQEQSDKSMAGSGTKSGKKFGEGVRKGAVPSGRMTGRDLGEQIRGGLMQTTDKTGKDYGRNLLGGTLPQAGNRIGQRLGTAINQNVSAQGGPAGQRFTKNMNVTVVLQGKQLGKRLGNAIAKNVTVGGIGVKIRTKIEEDSKPHVLAAARTVAGRFGVALNKALGSLSIGRTGGLVALITGLVEEASQLAAALAPGLEIVGILPAAATSAAAGISAVTVAFHGFGDALGKATSADTEKAKAALEKLAPAARAVVEEFTELSPRLGDLRKQVQQGFFKEVTGDLTALGTVLTGPVQRGMTEAAGAAGRLAHGIAGVLSSSQNFGVFDQIFDSAATAFDRMNGPMQTFTQGFLNWIRATLPAWDRLVASFATGTQKVGEFLSRAAQSGNALAWVNEAVTVWSQLFRITKSASQVIGTIFSAANQAGAGNYLNNLNSALVATRQFLAVGEGRTALVSFFEGLHETLQNLAPALQAAVVAIGQISRVAGSVSRGLSTGLAAVIRGIGQAIENAGPGLTKFATSVGGVLHTLGDILPSVGTSIGNLLAAAGPLVSVFGVAARAGAALLSIFSSLPQPILTVIGAFVGLRALGVPNLMSQIGERARTMRSGLSGVGGTLTTLTSTYQANLAALTNMRIQQQVANQAMAAGIPRVSRFGTAMGGIADRARAAGGAIGGKLLTGVGALGGALGGPVGIALGVASIAIGAWADKQAEADQKVADHAARVRVLGATLDKVTGSITEATRAQAQQTFAEGDLADSAKNLGLSIDQVSQAATGNQVAQGLLATKLRDSALGAIEADGSMQDLNDTASALGVSQSTLVDAMLGNEAAARKVGKALQDTGGDYALTIGHLSELIPDQRALGTEVNSTVSDLEAQGEAIRKANEAMGPAHTLAMNLGGAMLTLADNSSTAADKARALDTALTLLNGGTIALADAQREGADAVQQGNTAIDQMSAKYKVAGKSAKDLGISTQEFNARQKELKTALFDSSGAINFNSERARNLYDVSKNLRTATIDQTAAIIDNAQKTGGDMAAAHQRAADIMANARTQVIKWATELGYSSKEANQLATSMGLLPENVKIAASMEGVPAILDELGKIKGDIDILPDHKSIELHTNSPEVKEKLRDLGFVVEDVPGTKDIKITPNTEQAAAALRTFIASQITSRNPDLNIDANTDLAKLSAEDIRAFIENLPTYFKPGLDTGPVIAQWQDLLLGPLYPQPGTPKVTPSVNGAPAQAQASGLSGILNQIFGAQKPKVTPGVNTKPAKDGIGGLLVDPPPGDPTITPGVDGKALTNWFDQYLADLVPKGEPTITPDADTGPAQKKIEDMPVVPGLPWLTPSVNMGPAQTKVDGFITAATNTRIPGPTVNGNLVPANTGLTVLLNRINSSRGNVNVGANTSSGRASTNSLLGYVGRVGSSIHVGANTGAAFSAVSELLRYINSSVATVQVRTSRTPSIAAAEGGLFRYFADGGFSSMRPMPANRAEIVPPKSMRVIGDRARGDEAFIPLVNSARSRAVLQAAGAAMGFTMTPASEKPTQVTRTTNIESGAVVVNAPYSDPQLVARAVVNQLTREAVV
jgi:hypothetical protein